MLDRIIVSMATLVLLAADAQGAPKASQPKECPIEDFSHEVREEALRKASSCDIAMDLLRACSYGAGGDVSLGAVVAAKCEADFLAKFSAGERRTYDREQRRCAGKYRRETGTMYRSFEAFCSAELARSYAHKFAKRRGVRSTAGK